MINGGEAELMERLAQARVPLSYRQIRLSSLLVQVDDEPWPAFVERVRKMSGYGLARANVAAVNALTTWTPPERPGLSDWLVLHGPPGSGKTLLLAALVRRLVSDVATQVHTLSEAELLRAFGKDPIEDNRAWLARVRSLGRDRRIRPGSYRSVRYVVLPDLLRSERQSWSRHHATPEDVATVPGVKQIQVLVLDELATDKQPGDVECRLVEEILDHRADRGLLTLMATNRTPDEVRGAKGVYGGRVADRLRAARWVHIAGPSWRLGA